MKRKEKSKAERIVI